jgi:RimJ/RimL family protein N-acetyltransferase
MNPLMPATELLPIATARTTLRRLSTDDVAAFQAYRTDPEVGRWQGWSPMTGGEALAFLARMRRAPLFVPGEWCQIGIALRMSVDAVDAVDEGRLIGDIGLGVDPAHPDLAQVGFSMHRRWQGRGLAAEAVEAACVLLFEHGRMRRVEAITDTRNTSSMRLLERLGFRLERTEEALFRGLPCREHRYVRERPRGAGAAG